MTTTLTALAFLVAATAAARSTWSPCGLSMLSSITPFGETGRGHRYAGTCTWFVIGATMGGVALGGVAAGLAALVGSAGATATDVGVVALAAVVVAALSDAGVAGARLPVHHRQVNERWLDAYRPWVYGSGFGLQIGCGVATYITTAAVYLTAVLAALTAHPFTALLVGAVFGLLRGLAVTLTRRLQTPAALLAFHRRFAEVRPWADRAVLASLAISGIVLAVHLGPAIAGVALVAVAGTVVAVRLVAQPPSAASVDVADTASSSEHPLAPPVAAGGGTGSGRLSRQRR